MTWGPAIPQPFPPPYLSQVIYDPETDAVISVGPCPGSHPPPAESSSGTRCGSPFPCWSKSTDEGSHWSGFTPAGKGNGTYGGGEGTLGTALSTGKLLSPFSVSNCSDAASTTVNRVLISSDHSETWQVTIAMPRPTGWKLSIPLLVIGAKRDGSDCMLFMTRVRLEDPRLRWWTAKKSRGERALLPSWRMDLWC